MGGASRTWTSLIALLTVAGTPACAVHETSDEPVPAEGQHAELLGCSGYSPPARNINTISVPVRVTVTPTGTAERAVVPRTSLPEWAKREALDIVRTCRFDPAIEAGEAVEARTTVRFSFHTREPY